MIFQVATSDSDLLIPDSGLIPDGDLVITDSDLLIPGSELPIPGSELPIPGSDTLIPECDLVIPDCDLVNPDCDLVTPGSDTLIPVAVEVDPPASSSYVELKDLKLPSTPKKGRGRPKGAATTAIGLPNKRARRTKNLPFFKWDSHTKSTTMLHWYLNEEGKTILAGPVLPKLTAQHLKSANFLPAGCLDQAANLELIYRYFTEAGVRALKKVQQERQKIQTTCVKCSDNVIDNIAICCDSCLNSYHLDCLRLKTYPKSRFWFCSNCKV